MCPANDHPLRQRKAAPIDAAEVAVASLPKRTLDSLKPCEVCIDGVVYDISNFNHPGGERIHLFGGNDVTVFYKMIHPTYNKGHRLDKLQRIGIIPKYQCEYKFDTEFEREIKAEVNKIVPFGKQYGTPGWWSRAFLYIALFFYLQYHWVMTGTSTSLAIIYGISLALIGLNVQHDASHGASSKSPWINEVFGYFIDLIGWSKMIWMEEHYVHHAYTNQAEKDPDVFYVEPLLILHDYPLGHSARKWHHKFQALFYFPVISYLLTTIAFHPQVFDLKSRSVLSVGFKLDSEYVRTSVPMAVILKALFIVINFIIPVVKQGLNVETIFHLALGGVTAGLVLGGIFALSHNFEHSNRNPTQAFNTNGEPVCWFKAQVEAASSYGGFVSAALTGGLNFQIEHHLFPRMSSAWYPYIAPTVRKVCEKHGVKYVYFPWIWQNLASTLKFVHGTGTGSSWIQNHKK